MLRASIIVVLLFALFAPAKANELEKFIDAEMRTSSLPGIAWAVIHDGKVTTGANGHTIKGGTERVTGDTPFAIGSITKSFTALAVMQLLEADKIEPDQPVSRYIHVFRGKPAGAITVRQLLSHTSGFSTLQGNVSAPESEMLPDAISRRAAWYAQQEPAYEPGTRWEYSNANYLILGHLVQSVSGMPYPRYIQSNIFEPLGMDRSYISGNGRHPTPAKGHTPWFGSMRPVAARQEQSGLGSAPQGGIVSTASDLGRYLRMMLNGEDDILSAAGKARMLAPASDTSPGYGYGWMLNGEEQSAYHTGLTPGFEAIAAMIPGKRRGVLVLTNGVSGMGFAETVQLRYGTVARALDLPHPTESGRGLRIMNFLALALAPIVLVASMAWAWAKRDALREKRSSKLGLFSLWFPLIAMAGAAWVCVKLIPQLFGVPLVTLRLYQPDMALMLQATALLGMMWAVARLALAYSRRANPTG